MLTTDNEPCIYGRRTSRRPFDIESNSSFTQIDNEYGINPKHLNRDDNVGDDIKASVAARMNTLQKFSIDAKRTRTKVLSFSKPRESEK